MVELDHFNGIGECIQRLIDALGYGNELVLELSNSVARERSDWLEEFLQLFVILQIL